MQKIADPGLSGNFKHVDTPTQAVDRLAALYAQATGALRAAVEQYLVDGEAPTAAVRARFRYPELRVTYQPDTVPPSSARAFAKFSEPGVYSTTVTQPEDFRRYLLEQLEPLVDEFGASIEVGVGAQEIPYPYVFESGDELGRGGANAAELARFFPAPSLAAVGDEIADGAFEIRLGFERPIALFDATRVDYSLRRLVHYTGSDWRAMQPWVLLTNYHRYVDQFIHWGLEQLRAGSVIKLVLPGNVVIDSSSTPEEAEALAAAIVWHRFQMPAYHLMRADGRGVSLVNIGVGPSNAKTITDHLAVLRPHCWLMIGHCGGLRQSQSIGDYVLAHAYLRDDKVLDDVLPLGCADPGARPRCRSRCRRRSANVTGESGEALKRACAPAPSSPPTTATGSCAGRRSAAASTSRAPSPSTWNRRPSPPRATASACPTARCCASPTSRCTARSSCPARPTPSTSGRSASTCRSASRRWSCCAKERPRCTRASCAASTSRRSGERRAPSPASGRGGYSTNTVAIEATSSAAIVQLNGRAMRGSARARRIDAPSAAQAPLLGKPIAR